MSFFTSNAKSSKSQQKPFEKVVEFFRMKFWEFIFAGF